MAEFDRKLKKFKVNRNFKESIEPEEILFDATKSNDLEDQKLEVPLKPRVFRIFFGLIVLCLAVMAVDAGFSQIVKGNIIRIWPSATACAAFRYSLLAALFMTGQ